MHHPVGNMLLTSAFAQILSSCSHCCGGCFFKTALDLPSIPKGPCNAPIVGRWKMESGFMKMVVADTMKKRQFIAIFVYAQDADQSYQPWGMVAARVNPCLLW